MRLRPIRRHTWRRADRGRPRRRGLAFSTRPRTRTERRTLARRWSHRRRSSSPLSVRRSVPKILLLARASSRSVLRSISTPDAVDRQRYLHVHDRREHGRLHRHVQLPLRLADDLVADPHLPRHGHVLRPRQPSVLHGRAFLEWRGCGHHRRSHRVRSVSIDRSDLAVLSLRLLSASSSSFGASVSTASVAH